MVVNKASFTFTICSKDNGRGRIHFSNSIIIISLIFYIIRLLPFFIRDFIVKVCTHFTVRKSTPEWSSSSREGRPVIVRVSTHPKKNFQIFYG